MQVHLVNNVPHYALLALIDNVEVGSRGKAFAEETVDQQAAGYSATACQPAEIRDHVRFDRDKIPSPRESDIRLDLPGLVPDIRQVVAIPVLRQLAQAPRPREAGPAARRPSITLSHTTGSPFLRFLDSAFGCLLLAA